MVGINLTADEIRAAPQEVRAWLAHQMAGLFGAGMPEASQPDPQSLAACSIEEARAILAQIQDMLPVVSVFFELGREQAATASPGIRALNLQDLQRHAKLRAPEQAVQCPEVINQVLGAIRNDPKARLCALDPRGRCFVAEATSQAILALWHEIVAARALGPIGGADQAQGAGAGRQTTA